MSPGIRDSASKPLILALLVLAGLSILAASCSAAWPGISNGSVTVCYRAIPTARDALHSRQATLVGVHRMSADLVRSRLAPAAGGELASENDTSVCVLTFEDDFAAGQVQGAPGGQSGRYAVVVVSSHQLDVLADLRGRPAADRPRPKIDLSRIRSELIKYLGSKRRLVPVLGDLFSRSGARTGLDVFTGTTRVAQEWKRRGGNVTAVDLARYSHVLANCYIATDGSQVDRLALTEAIDTCRGSPVWTVT